MILPSDSDLPPDRNEGDDPSEEPDDATKWWEEGDDGADSDSAGLPDDLDSIPDDLDDPNAPELQSVAGPGWRNDLYKDLIESLRDLEAIEDPDDAFAPPEPPDLYTFFGELAALRLEFRNDGRRTQQALAELAQFLPSAAAPAGSIRRRGKPGTEGPAAAEPWPMENCLALVSLWDFLPHATSLQACWSSFQPLLRSAGLTKIETIGQAFDPATMIRAGTEPALKNSVAGLVLRETTAGFLRAGILLRPAGVITASQRDV